jgi:hypothetical protein
MDLFDFCLILHNWLVEVPYSSNWIHDENNNYSNRDEEIADNSYELPNSDGQGRKLLYYLLERATNNKHLPYSNGSNLFTSSS